MRPTASATNAIILAVLEAPGERVRSREIAKDAAVSQRAASDVLRFLAFHGGVTPDRRVRWHRTAEIAAMLRLPAMTPERTFSSSAGATEVAQRLSEENIPALLAFTTAANRWAFFEPHREIQFIIAKGHATRAMRAIEAMRTGNKETWGITLFEGDTSALGKSRVDDVLITNQLQTWIDLKHFPQAGAHEAFFRQVIEDRYPQASAP